VCVSGALPSLEVVCEEAFSEDEGGDDMALREVCDARERGGYWEREVSVTQNISP